METDTTQAAFGVLGETGDFLAADKPAGLLVHPTKPGGPKTLWDGLRELLAYELACGGQVSIINRLDRETSGVVLVAKSAAAAREAARAMEAGRVKKRYVAVTAGWPPDDQFEVDAPILRLGEVGPSAIWLKRGVHPRGARSRTRVRVLERRSHRVLGDVAAVEAEPLTGRTHQIRVHLAHAGYPVVGDKIYGPDERWYLRFVESGWSDEMRAALWLERHALHSAAIGFEACGVQLAWRSPLPEDMAALVEDGICLGGRTR